MKNATPHIQIILPVYNERDNLPILLKEIDRSIAFLKGEANVTYLFVNDGSKDGTREFLIQANEERDDIQLVDLIHNFGHSAAISCGLDHFDADIAILMDADLQDSPDILPAMFAAWKKGEKTVVAERGERGERHQILFKSFYFLLHRIAKQLPPISFGTHCLLDASIVERIRLLKEKNRYFPGLVNYASNSIYPILADRADRHHGESRVGMTGLINLAVTAFLSFSNFPVRMVSLLGLFASSVSILFGIGIVGIKLFSDKAIPGWASTMTATAFSSGIELLCLGMIGEYIARIYDEVKQRPLYLVDRIYPPKRHGKKSKNVA